jgi:hypothetical protein
MKCLKAPGWANAPWHDISPFGAHIQAMGLAFSAACLRKMIACMRCIAAA